MSIIIIKGITQGENIGGFDMNIFTIQATARRHTAYLKNERVQTEAPKCIITLVTHRCNVEAILASMNIEEYQIVDCDHKVQIMAEPKKIPHYYYQPIGSKTLED